MACGATSTSATWTTNWRRSIAVCTAAKATTSRAPVTSFGEQKLTLDLFGAEPGTIPSRQDFRGTGGSLYFLRHQDILTGSERIRIEVRDKVTGIVTGVVNLSPSVDYDIDYLQGTVVLSEPLAATVDDKLLVRTGASGGDESYLVVRYEYTPGFEEIGALAVGGQAHYWLNDYIQVGVTANDNSNSDDDQSSLQGADMTVRLTAGVVAETAERPQRGHAQPVVRLERRRLRVPGCRRARRRRHRCQRVSRRHQRRPAGHLRSA